MALGEKVRLKCQKCGDISVGGLRGFWRMGRLGVTKMVLITFTIISGLTYVNLVQHLGVDINKNTWTRYVKDVGLVCAEALEKSKCV